MRRCLVHFYSIFLDHSLLSQPLADHSTMSVILHEDASDLDIMKAVLTAEIFFFAVDSFQLDQSVS